MLFKLSVKNIRKSIKDYTIYFLTLILGVAIFYIFNSLDSQTAMMVVSSSTEEIIQMMVSVLAGVSVCVALILGFLIIYANNFLIKRRKREFAVYMTLGMGKHSISKILLGETVLIGLLSLGAGLAIGIFASQFMSILVANMFEADMSAYTFIFSGKAMIKTIVYFSIMYMMVVIFNVIMISRYQLIDLFLAAKKMERGKIGRSWLAAVVFGAAVGILCYAYYQVTVNALTLNRNDIMQMVVLGCVGTFLVFWSLSGFLLKLLQKLKGFYYHGLNSFVLRQVNGNINTAVFSMTIICLMFFVTICVLSSGLAMNNAFRSSLMELCPRDVNLNKKMDPATTDSPLTVTESLQELGFDLTLFAPGYVEITSYTNENVTLQSFFEDTNVGLKENFPLMDEEVKESIVGISEYNKLASLYGQPEYQLSAGEYVMLCTFEKMVALRNTVLQEGRTITISGMEFKPRYDTCQPGFLDMNVSNLNLGVILVPDNVIEQAGELGLQMEHSILAADYAGVTKEEKQHIESILFGRTQFSLYNGGIGGMSKITIYESSVGMSAVITFIAIYLGIVFLIAGAALLALKELSESTDNKERYAILNKLGADRGMQRRALLWQMGIFFGLPMALAVIHSIFGIRYVHRIMILYQGKDLLLSIVITAAVLVLVYGSYFTATYYGSRRIIEE